MTLSPETVPLAERFNPSKENCNDEAEGSAECVVDQTLFNWVKAKREGKLISTDSKPVSAEQMEIARQRAELARVEMERDILEKATAYFVKTSKRSLTSSNATGAIRHEKTPTGLGWGFDIGGG